MNIVRKRQLYAGTEGYSYQTNAPQESAEEAALLEIQYSLAGPGPIPDQTPVPHLYLSTFANGNYAVVGLWVPGDMEQETESQLSAREFEIIRED